MERKNKILLLRSALSGVLSVNELIAEVYPRPPFILDDVSNEELKRFCIVASVVGFPIDSALLDADELEFMKKMETKMKAKIIKS